MNFLVTLFTWVLINWCSHSRRASCCFLETSKLWGPARCIICTPWVELLAVIGISEWKILQYMVSTCRIVGKLGLRWCFNHVSLYYVVFGSYWFPMYRSCGWFRPSLLLKLVQYPCVGGRICHHKIQKCRDLTTSLNFSMAMPDSLHHVLLRMFNYCKNVFIHRVLCGQSIHIVNWTQIMPNEYPKLV